MMKHGVYTNTGSARNIVSDEGKLYLVGPSTVGIGIDLDEVQVNTRVMFDIQPGTRVAKTVQHERVDAATGGA